MRVIAQSLVVFDWQQSKVWMALTVGLWRGTIKEIESNFGSAIGTYYRLMRFQIYLNLLTACVWVRAVSLALLYRHEDMSYPP